MVLLWATDQAQIFGAWLYSVPKCTFDLCGDSLINQWMHILLGLFGTEVNGKSLPGGDLVVSNRTMRRRWVAGLDQLARYLQFQSVGRPQIKYVWSFSCISTIVIIAPLLPYLFMHTPTHLPAMLGNGWVVNRSGGWSDRMWYRKELHYVSNESSSSDYLKPCLSLPESDRRSRKYGVKRVLDW